MNIQFPSEDESGPWMLGVGCSSIDRCTVLPPFVVAPSGAFPLATPLRAHYKQPDARTLSGCNESQMRR